MSLALDLEDSFVPSSSVQDDNLTDDEMKTMEYLDRYKTLAKIGEQWLCDYQLNNTI